MREMMIDLETMDTTPSAVILSIGAVVWENKVVDAYDPVSQSRGPMQDYEIVERLYRKPHTDPQLREGRTRSTATLMWWDRQDRDAYDEAWSNIGRCEIETMWRDLMLMAVVHGITRFWASPVTFDFPILDSYKRSFALNDIWSYNQMYDVRTVVLESGISTKDHVPMREIAGKAHMPVTDCEWQIDLLTAARRALCRRIESATA